MRLRDFVVGRDTAARLMQFDLLRWFSIVSVLIITLVALGLGFIASRFVVNESIQRDADLTAQFIQSLASSELSKHYLPNRQMGEVLDPRIDIVLSNQERLRRQTARREFLAHIENISKQPDSLLINIYAPDNVVIWSSNPALVGMQIWDDEELARSFATRKRVSATYHSAVPEREEQNFPRPPQGLFIENYIPMLNASGEAVALIEIYKEPSDLIGRTQRGYLLMWLATSIGGALIYLALYRVVRKAAGLLITQQKQIIENETLVAMGEMSSAVAHSLRNPLASIRSSAELMQALAPDALQRNLTDVITQVDRMSQWVRDLLVTSGPSAGASENVDPLGVVEEALASFQSQIRNSGVEVDLVAANDQPAVLSQRLLLLQVLNSLFSNALEAMPKGGLLTVEVLKHSSEPKLTIAIADTGSGMSDSQRKKLFQPFTTTKQGGLGIGLVMVKRIMERFGGQVDIHSAQNEGTRVCLTFALAAQ